MTSEPENQLVTALQRWVGQIMRLSMRQSLLYARRHGLSVAHMVAMAHLQRHTCCKVSDLAASLGVTSAAASQMIDRLVHLGYVSRLENPTDRRSRQLTLTDAGREILREALAARQQWLGALASQLSPEERMQITEALAVLSEHTSRLEQT